MVACPGEGRKLLVRQSLGALKEVARMDATGKRA
jgi:hypothetical protein